MKSNGRLIVLKSKLVVLQQPKSAIALPVSYNCINLSGLNNMYSAFMRASTFVDQEEGDATEPCDTDEAIEAYIVRECRGSDDEDDDAMEQEEEEPEPEEVPPTTSEAAKALTTVVAFLEADTDSHVVDKDILLRLYSLQQQVTIYRQRTATQTQITSFFQSRHSSL